MANLNLLDFVEHAGNVGLQVGLFANNNTPFVNFLILQPSLRICVSFYVGLLWECYSVFYSSITMRVFQFEHQNRLAIQHSLA